MCDDQYLGTLFSGQVLTQPPTKGGFELVQASVAGQPHIDLNSLEAAYYRVPVVSPAKLAEMVRVLELFARKISNSWKRLQIMSEFQRTQDRQLALDRRELAALLLSGEPVDVPELNDLARRAELRHLPDRVLVIHIAIPDAGQGSLPQIGDQMTLHRLSHAVEDLCQTWTDTIAMAVRPGELCILTAREARNPGHERIKVEEIAEALLAKVRSLGGGTARVGISASHASPTELVRAYQEACAAVESNTSAVKFFDGRPAPKSLSTERIEKLLNSIRTGISVAVAVREFLADALPRDNSPAKLQKSRAFLTWAIEHINLEVVSMGAGSDELATVKEQTLTAVLHSPTPFSACEAFGNYAKLAAQHVASTFADREQKIVLSVRQLIDERGVAQLSIQEIAAALRLSAGHLSRIYRRATGMTLEGFLIRQRVELAKRTMLDPRPNVAEVAERCGFCNPAYFAYVFKKYISCTPREFARRPHLSAQA